jgi:hypothetical protein
MTVEEKNFPAKRSHLHSSEPIMNGQNNDINPLKVELNPISKSQLAELFCRVD